MKAHDSRLALWLLLAVQMQIWISLAAPHFFGIPWHELSDRIATAPVRTTLVAVAIVVQLLPALICAVCLMSRWPTTHCLCATLAVVACGAILEILLDYVPQLGGPVRLPPHSLSAVLRLVERLSGSLAVLVTPLLLLLATPRWRSRRFDAYPPAMAHRLACTLAGLGGVLALQLTNGMFRWAPARAWHGLSAAAGGSSVRLADDLLCRALCVALLASPAVLTWAIWVAVRRPERTPVAVRLVSVAAALTCALAIARTVTTAGKGAWMAEWRLLFGTTGWAVWGAFNSAIAFIAVSVVLTLAWRDCLWRGRLYRLGECQSCGYPAVGWFGARCPECGAVDAATARLGDSRAMGCRDAVDDKVRAGDGRAG